MQGEENSVVAAGSKKVWNKGRGKSRLRAGRGLLTLTPQISNTILSGETSARQTIKGPRMPDGTRGFTMGRGRPLNSVSTSHSCAPPLVSLVTK